MEIQNGGIMEQPIKYFSMFSGIGGFEYGMEQSDYEFECVGYSEIDKYARSIYEKHYPNHINYGDATRINTEDLPSFEFLVGGFPCQAFSIAGKRKGFDEARGTLFFEIARVLRDKKPARFLLENVKGLLSHDRGRTVQTIFRVCDELGYDVSWAVYNSKDYGVPQSRERIFLKGYFREGSSKKALYNSKNEKKNNPLKIEIIGKILDWGQCGRVMSTKGICPTITSSWLPVGFFEVDKNTIRTLTPLEYERLQGFPDNWTKYGKDNEPISDTQRYKCCGNAVTTNVITAIINEMFKEVIEDETD